MIAMMQSLFAAILSMIASALGFVAGLGTYLLSLVGLSPPAMPAVLAAGETVAAGEAAVEATALTATAITIPLWYTVGAIALMVTLVFLGVGLIRAIIGMSKEVKKANTNWDAAKEVAYTPVRTVVDAAKSVADAGKGAWWAISTPFAWAGHKIANGYRSTKAYFMGPDAAKALDDVVTLLDELDNVVKMLPADQRGTLCTETRKVRPEAADLMDSAIAKADKADAEAAKGSEPTGGVAPASAN